MSLVIECYFLRQRCLLLINDVQPLEKIEYADKALSITGIFSKTNNSLSNQQFLFIDNRYINSASAIYSTLNSFISRNTPLTNPCYALFLKTTGTLVYDFDLLDSTVTFLVCL
jgi:DNA mismatch repair ATPase MutL